MKGTNANWARRQIAMHGIDRYPTVEMQFIKLVEEAGELGKEINKRGKQGGKVEDLVGELADTALALYNLADKLGFDLDEAIRRKVQTDQRKFG